MTDSDILTARELRIVDEAGTPRLVLSAEGGKAAVVLSNPKPDGPDARLEIDDKGAHLRFDHPGGGNAYFFQNDVGNMGLVLTDASGKRRVHATVAADGSSRIERLDDDGNPVA